MQAQKGISSGGAEAFSSVIIHIFLLPHFNPNIFLHFYPGEITARNEFSFFLGYAVARVWRPLICANWFPLSLGNRHDKRIQNSGGYFQAVGLVILGGYGRPGSVAFFLFFVPLLFLHLAHVHSWRLVKILCERECVRVCGIFFYPISVYLASVFLPLFQSHSILLIFKTHLLFSFPACLMRPLSASFEWDGALAAAVWSLGYFSDDRLMGWQLLD